MQYSDFKEKLSPCRNKNILLGFSGGADSCALFLILAYWQKIIPFDLTAVHFEHGLRGEESLKDAEFCERTAAEYGIKFLKYHLHVPENMLKNETMEAAARRLRLEKWQEISCGIDDFEIHLAHHSDDLAENVLLRLFRGANVSGMSGLREYSELNGLHLRRILLDFSRRDIEDFLAAEKFTEYRVDSTNTDCNIGRNYLRNKLLRDIEKQFPYAVKGIVQSAKVCEADADFLEKSAAAEFAGIDGKDEVENIFWSQLHSALRVRVMRSYFSSKLGYEYIPDKNFIIRFEESLSCDNSKFEHKIELDEQNYYTRYNDKWHIVSKKSPPLADVYWHWQNVSEVIFGDYLYKCQLTDEFIAGDGKYYFAADELSCPLKITAKKEGETFEKFGGGHSSVSDELTNHKIHGSERERIGILRTVTDEILLIGTLRRSSYAPIIGKKRKILQISVEKLKK